MWVRHTEGERVAEGKIHISRRIAKASSERLPRRYRGVSLLEANILYLVDYSLSFLALILFGSISDLLEACIFKIILGKKINIIIDQCGYLLG